MILTYLSYKFQRKFHVHNISYLPGSWIDDIFTEETNSVSGKIVREIKIRAIFFLLFPILAIFNVISNLIVSISYSFAGKLSSSPKDKVKYRAVSDQTFDNVISNLFGLTFCIPIGLLYMREFSSMMVAPPSKSIQRTGGSFAHLHATVVYPKSIEEIASLVKTCASNNEKIAVRGAGASQGLQYQPQGKGVLIDLKHLSKVELNASENTVTVGAGATWGRVEQFLAPAGRAIDVRQASNIFSVGGSISANVHGWAHKSGTIANTIEEITIINAHGVIQKLKPKDELFGYVVGGFGQFGVIVEAKLRVIPNEVLKEKGVLLSVNDYMQYYKHGVTHNSVEPPLDPNTKLHLYRLSLKRGELLKSGVAVQYVADPANPSTEPERVYIYNEGPRGTRFQRIMTNIARRFSWLRTMYWSMEAKRIISGKSAECTTVEHMQAPILAMIRKTRSDSEWLQEYFIPGENLAQFLNELGDLLEKNDVTLINASVRPVKQDTITKMGYANKCDMFAVVLCFNQKLDDESRLKTRRWVKEANDITIRNNGTYYLVYQPFATKEQFEKSYPQYKLVLAKKRQVDPNNVFATEFSKYFYEEEFNPYKHVFDSAERMEEFAGFLNNILMEIEPEKLNALLKDILSYADTAEDIFKEMLRRMPEIAPSFTRSTYRAIKSLRALKNDLAAQAKHLMDVDGIRTQPINGTLEVGYPGRHVPELVKQLGIVGKVDVLQEAYSPTDFIQSGLPRTHKRSFILNFKMPNLDQLDPLSYDLVTCFVGLHHFDMQALDAFLRKLNIIMRKNGSFLLMDHDVTDDTSYAMAYLAHSVFNAVKGFTLRDEIAEIRDFRSIAQWQAILAKYGFEMDPQPAERLIRTGDPSVNTMVRFRKIAELKETIAANNDTVTLLKVEALQPYRPVVVKQQIILPVTDSACNYTGSNVKENPANSKLLTFSPGADFSGMPKPSTRRSATLLQELGLTEQEVTSVRHKRSNSLSWM